MITEEHYEELDKIFKTCVDNTDLLNDWENDFISDFIDKLDEHETKLKVSEKQQQIIDRVANKLRKAGVL